MQQQAQVYPAEVVEAIHDGYRRELAELEARNAYYRALLAEHGVVVDDAEDRRVRWGSDEHLRGCRELVAAAYNALAVARRFEGALGPAQELLEETSWLEAKERRAA